MKKWIHSDVLALDIDISFVENLLRYSDQFDNVAATTIDPIVLDWKNKIVDPEALSDFNTFVQNVFEILDYYDFEVLEDFKKKSKSFPHTSEYRWIAHRSEIESDNVPKFIKLRIADHIQNFNEERQSELKKEYARQAQVIAVPQSKKKQRYILENIVVNNQTHNTYEEAYHDIELTIHDRLESRNIDMSQYEPLGW